MSEYTDTAEYFDTVAEDWEKLKKEILEGADISGRLEAVIPVCRTAADLGCGTGDLLPVLSVKAKQVIGVDNSPGMLQEAAKRHGFDESRISLRVGDLLHLPLRDGEADCAVMTMVLHHVPDPGKVLQESARILKSGNKLVILDLVKHTDERMRTRYHDRWLGFNRDEMTDWLDAAGFSLDGEEIIPLKSGLKAFLYQAARK